MRIRYTNQNFSDKSKATIELANDIIAEYGRQGFVLTLRQLYYQFVARDLIANKVTEYKRLGSIVNDGRLAGLIDWSAIEDRTRNLQSLAHWENPAAIVEACAGQFQVDRWENQGTRVEVWIEKEALAGVFDGVCKDHDVPLFACRGYVSQSELHSAAQRLKAHGLHGQKTIILHFGDHDPSGMDMTRDIENRMRIFDCDVEVRRLALTMDQIREFNPPPNPAKETDSRFAGYLREYGDKSWELDALEPRVLADLVTTGLALFTNQGQWDRDEVREQNGRIELRRVADNWTELGLFLDEED